MNISDSVGATFARMAVSSYHHVFLVTGKIRGGEETLQGAKEDTFQQ